MVYETMRRVNEGHLRGTWSHSDSLGQTTEVKIIVIKQVIIKG